MTVKVASSMFVNQLNATKLKSSKAQIQFQFELSLAQLSPSLFKLSVTVLIASHAKSKMNTRGPQNFQWGLERDPTLDYQFKSLIDQ